MFQLYNWGGKYKVIRSIETMEKPITWQLLITIYYFHYLPFSQSLSLLVSQSLSLSVSLSLSLSVPQSPRGQRTSPFGIA